MSEPNEIWQMPDKEDHESDWDWKKLPPANLEESTEDTSAAPAFQEANQSDIKIGIVGGKGVGKTFFFSALIYRLIDSDRAGALSGYVKNASLDVFHSGQIHPVSSYVTSYSNWHIPFATITAEPAEYTLRLGLRTGILGRKRSLVNIGLIDGAGEAFLRQPNSITMPIWNIIRDATVVLFCLPLWALFPDSRSMTDEDWHIRDQVLSDFSHVVTNYHAVRKRDLKVKSILLLTMADDNSRCALRTLHDRWVRPVLADPEEFLSSLRRKSGVMNYLGAAREVSRYLYREMTRVDFRRASLFFRPAALDLGYGLPWIIPVSSVEGKTLERINDVRRADPTERLSERIDPPVPAHVELPLLVALCQHFNVLM